MTTLKTVISASRRTDIPAFYLDWFIQRLKAGHVELENPLYPAQKRTVDLSPENVEWIVFWSRNYARFLQNRSAFEAYRLFFHFTILPNSAFDSRAPEPEAVLPQIGELAAVYGPQCVVWRYDPLLFWEVNGKPASNHEPEKFSFLCERIGALGITTCYTSVAYPYSTFINRARKVLPGYGIESPGLQKLQNILKEMVSTASAAGITLHVCSNEYLEPVEGIEKARCIDGPYLNSLTGRKIVSGAQSPSREGCGCTRSVDIGSYRQHPCHYGCLYCYANPVWKRR